MFCVDDVDTRAVVVCGQSAFMAFFWEKGVVSRMQSYGRYYFDIRTLQSFCRLRGTPFDTLSSLLITCFLPPNSSNEGTQGVPEALPRTNRVSKTHISY
jgi:hypothetical protein